MNLNVQYGAGWCCPPDWLNFDASPSLRFERLPIVGRYLKVNQTRFPEGVRIGDIVVRLPVEDQSAKAVFASHVLEHLALADFHAALKNTLRILQPGGVFRLVVPDLHARAKLYITEAAAGDAKAAGRFLRVTHLGVEARPRNSVSRVRQLFGNSGHLWMWDSLSMSSALQSAGFVHVRPCEIGDADEPAFKSVEMPHRFFNEELQIKELAMEARAPL